MARRALGEGDVEVVEAIAGGTQNVLLRVRRGSLEAVLRLPPPHKRANSDETMRREARVLAALAATAVPHPRLIAGEPDETVLGSAFYLMEAVDGINPSLGLPPAGAGDPAWQRALGFSMVDAIAALSAVDHVALGLGDLGRWDGWADRQVGRWRRQLDSYSALPGYPGPEIPGVDEVGAWLDAHRPSHLRAGLIHGDFHLANVLVHRDEPRLAAIVDWELVTVGDPLLDLGHLLATWPTGSGVSVGQAVVGLPDHDELIDLYTRLTGREPGDVAWFRVLACYRLGLILEGTHARACAGLAPRATGDLLHAHTVSLFEQALGLIG
jgi:aminoglycoside phosphotransferase (APT) family kinase protein